MTLTMKNRDIELSCCPHQQSSKEAEIVNSISVFWSINKFQDNDMENKSILSLFAMHSTLITYVIFHSIFTFLRSNTNTRVAKLVAHEDKLPC